MGANYLGIPPSPIEYDRRPRVQLSYSHYITHACSNEEALDVARLALKSWNDKCSFNKGCAFELLEVVGAKRIADPYIVHCNFIAKPHRGSEADHKLFFAEVMYSLDFKSKHTREYGDDGCTVCCILGPVGTKTGLFSCRICDVDPDLVQHPENGEFTKGLVDYENKEIAKNDLAIRNRRGRRPETMADECALIALLSWNAKSSSEQGPEYELDEVLGFKRMAGPTIYQCNFLARPINKSEPENMLFFAELKYSKDYGKDGEEAALGCQVCCILGPPGTATGNLGCTICKERYAMRVHHPIYEDFIKGRKDAMSKSIAKKKLSEIR